MLHRYPVNARPFYTMLCEDDPRFTCSYDFFMRGEEILSGAQRIHDPVFLEKRAVEKGIDPKTINDYFEAMKYGAYPHGGGAFSGKDPSKVDRSAAYATRHIAKNLVAAGLCKQVLVQVSYAIGVAKPMGIFVDTYGTAQVDFSDGDIAKAVENIFDMRPAAIIERLKLKNPIYQETAAYGHMGRTPQTKTFSFNVEGQNKEMTLETFTWEKLDYVDKVKATFGL